VRSGVRPSILEITNNGVPEVYDAFVHAVRWISMTESLRPAAHRNLVAWRRTGPVLQVLLVGLPVDSAPVVHPYSMRPSAPGGALDSPLDGAKAAYFERTSQGGTTWLGIGGAAKIAEQTVLSACSDANAGDRPDGVACQMARFGVTLSVELAQAPTRDSRDVPPDASTRWLHAPDQTVAGVKLLFSCAEPAVDGCPTSGPGPS
jgi:hypothetical protein